MRRSVYQKQFYSGSFLYATETPKKKPEYQRAYHSFIDTSTNYVGSEDGARSLLAQRSDEAFVVRANYERYSCSGITHLDQPPASTQRPFRSADYEAFSSPEPLSRLHREVSQDSDASFKKSQDSDIFIPPYSDPGEVFQGSERSSSGSFVSHRTRARSEKAYSHADDIEMDVISRQSSEGSEVLARRRFRDPLKSDLSFESENSGQSYDMRSYQEELRRRWLKVEISEDSDEMIFVEHPAQVHHDPPRSRAQELSVDSDDVEEFMSKHSSDRGHNESQDSDEMTDMFASKLDVSQRQAFRKERSLDSDETSGFVSKHSSETTDFSSKLSSSSGNFTATTKHLSEPLNFGSSVTTDALSQRFSEPSAFLSSGQPEEKPTRYGQFLKVEEPTDKPDVSTGAISKNQKRERFRRSKRIKHFNLRRIDDTDNDSSCDSDRFLMAPKPSEEAVEMLEVGSARLKEEVGLPRHLSRDGSSDRYGLYKCRSEKTITSFESDRFGPGTLHDFESFCDAVMFSKRSETARIHLSPARQPLSGESANETDEVATEDEILKTEATAAPAKRMRKSKSKRDLSQRLKCLLL